MTKPTIEELINIYDLRPHPEGGYYRETYRDHRIVARNALPEGYSGDRNFSTAIYYLITSDSSSLLHRLRSDEMFHFYLGGPMTVAQIFPNGKIEKTVMGHDVTAGHKMQHLVSAGCWFGAYPNPGTEYSFVGATVSPGFDFADFALGDRKELSAQYPQAREVIERLTP